MTAAPAATLDQPPLEAVLLDVQATLGELLVAADEQYAAVAQRDRDRIEGVTRVQEHLSARLARAEARRLKLLGGASLGQAISDLPQDRAARLSALKDEIATAVGKLKDRQRQTANLLQQNIELTGQTLDFLQRLVTPPAPAYTVRGIPASQCSVLVDGRA